MKYPLVSVIIPHHNGIEILNQCLASLAAATYPRIETMVVDNGSSDRSADFVRRHYPDVHLLELGCNRGFAGGCNSGIRAAAGELVCILNNDTVQEPDWLDHLVRVLICDDALAVVQPKIISFQERRRFDYSGAGGGQIDLFGYPFARGRLFEEVEVDEGQYDEEADIFWASGTAMLAKRKILVRAGLFSEWFFAHMEEIDLQWRLHSMGYRIRVVPSAVVYHHSGYTLKTGSWRKIYLNHRNNLLMVACNYETPALLAFFPLRLLLEFASWLMSLARADFKRALAIPLALVWLVLHPQILIKGRYQVRRLRRVSDEAVIRKMYKAPVAFDYFFGRIRRYEQLKKWI